MADSRGRPDYRRRERVRARLKALGEPCAICGRPIDYDLDWWVDPKDGRRKRHPLSFEYDHRQPTARGGGNDWDNAQAAHRICNQRKGARGGPGEPKSPKNKKMPEGGELPISRAW